MCAASFKQVGQKEPIPTKDARGRALGPRAAIREFERRRGLKWLELLANAGSSDFMRWRGQWLDAPDEDSMEGLQAELRQVWEALASGKRDAESDVTVRTMIQWVDWRREGVPVLTVFSGVEPINRMVLVNPCVLRYQLALAVSEARGRFYR